MSSLFQWQPFDVIIVSMATVQSYFQALPRFLLMTIFIFVEAAENPRTILHATIFFLHIVEEFNYEIRISHKKVPPDFANVIYPYPLKFIFIVVEMLDNIAHEPY
jgi:hypothetical protein